MLGKNCGAHQDPCQSFRSTDACRSNLKESLCNRIKRAQDSSKILENVLDIASTLVKVMHVCGIHECKTSRALDVIIYAFMHFDEVTDHPGGKCKKRIRKEEFYTDMMRDCGMTKAEAKLSYSIVKCAFKAFYHKQIINRYDAAYVDECEWKNAANRTINAFAQSGATQSEVELTGKRILCAYENYLCRLQSKDAPCPEPVKKCTCSQGKRPCPHASPCPQDPCKPPCPEDPALCGRLRCEVVCPPGSLCPQVICRDPCGRTFLRVDGDRINFDPLIMECEARRAAMGICPTTNADRLKALRDCLNICKPPDDSCDELDICKEEGEEEGKCDEDGSDETVCEEEGEHISSETIACVLGGGEDGKVCLKDYGEDEDDLSCLFVEIHFRKTENIPAEHILDVKVHGGCVLNKEFVESLEELEVQLNDDPPILYSASPVTMGSTKSDISSHVTGSPSMTAKSIKSLHSPSMTAKSIQSLRPPMEAESNS